MSNVYNIFTKEQLPEDAAEATAKGIQEIYKAFIDLIVDNEFNPFWAAIACEFIKQQGVSITKDRLDGVWDRKLIDGAFKELCKQFETS